MLRLALVNLIANAVKIHAPRASRPRIEIGFKEQKNRIRVVVFVRDNGVGFDIEICKQTIRRVPTSSLALRRFEGTGHRPGHGFSAIIHRHGGTVWAEGRRGSGRNILLLTFPTHRELIYEYRTEFCWSRDDPQRRGALR